MASNIKKELIYFLRIEGNDIGMEQAQIILEKYNINFKYLAR